MFRIKGTLKGKKYLSNKKFRTEQAALKHAYSNLVYTGKGEKKKKHSLGNIEIVKV